MKNKTSKPNTKAAAEVVQPPTATTPQIDPFAEEAFLQDAENEPKRIRLDDHIKTIRTLRDKKKLTFRAIAEWFGERGLETDQSAVYRAYCASFPEVDEHGVPLDYYKSVEEQDSVPEVDSYENATLKKKPQS